MYAGGHLTLNFLNSFIKFRFFRATNVAVDAQECRSQERYLLAAWAALANFICTGMGLISLVITVPLTLPYLGEERFGVWMTVSSIAALLSFLDFGISNGLINRVAAVNTKNDVGELGFVITHGLVILCGVGLVIGAVMFPVFFILPWEKIIKVSNPVAAEEVRATLVVFIAIFVASIPINGIQKIFQGLQLAWQAHLCRALGSAISLMLVYKLAKTQAGVPELLLVTFGMQTIILLPLLIVLYRRKLLRFERFHQYSWEDESRQLVKAGGLFFLLQIATLTGWGADSLIISSTLGVALVTKFVLVQRLFQFVIMPLGIINAPLWSAYADANARGDRAFIAKTLKRSLAVTTIAAIAGVSIISPASPWIFELWLKDASTVPMSVVWTYGVWAIFLASGTAFATFLNGVGEIKSQVVTVVLFCITTLPLKLLLVPSYGLVGLIAVTIGTYFVTVVLPYLSVFKVVIRRYLV